LVAPARCCLKNIGQVSASNETTAAEDSGTCDLSLEERIVEKAFDYLKTVSLILRDRFDL